MTLSKDLRERAVRAYRNKEGSQEVIAERFKIARSTLQEWLKAPESPEDKPETRGRPRALSPEDLIRLEKLVKKHKDAGEEELATLLAPEGEAPKHRSIIGRASALSVRKSGKSIRSLVASVASISGPDNRVSRPMSTRGD